MTPNICSGDSFTMIDLFGIHWIICFQWDKEHFVMKKFKWVGLWDTTIFSVNIT